MSVDIQFAHLNRERKCRGSKGSTTFTFDILNGSSTRAEVIFTDGGVEIIEQCGQDAKKAARLALERLLAAGRNPFRFPVFLRVSYQHAEYFAKHGNFHESLCGVGGDSREVRATTPS